VNGYQFVLAVARVALALFAPTPCASVTVCDHPTPCASVTVCDARPSTSAGTWPSGEPALLGYNKTGKTGVLTEGDYWMRSR